MSTRPKQIGRKVLIGLGLMAMTTASASGGPMMMRMAMPMPMSPPNFRVPTQPIPPFIGFMTNPNVGMTMTRPASQQTMLSRAAQRAAQNTNAAMSTMPNNVMFPWRNGYPGSSSYPYSSSPYSSGMNGAADVMTAQSQMTIANQQAEMTQRTVLRTKLENHRRLFDAWLYERANTPSMEDLREREQELVFRRSRNDPPLTEILSALALNSLLIELQKLEAKGITLTSVELDEGVLKNINVTATQNGANFGLLKHDGPLSWPVVLRDLAPAAETQELRKEIDSLIKEALFQAKNGKTEPGLLAQLYVDVRFCRELLKKTAGDVTSHRYIAARRFLDDLENAVKVLERDDAANFILGKFAAKGKTVRELLKHMNSLGLVFAPAVSGDEAAYVALQRSLAEASYRAQLQTATER